MFDLPMIIIDSDSVPSPYTVPDAPWVVISTETSANAADVMQVKNTQADGYSSIGFLDSAGTRKAGIGYGNASLAAPYTATTYLDYGTAWFDFLPATAVGSDQAVGMRLINRTAAAAGSQQYSPMLLMTGYGWKTDATAASRPVDFAFQVQTIQGTSAPSGNLQIYSRIAAGTWTSIATISSAGALTVTGAVYLPDGAVGTPALSFTADSNTGIYRLGSDEFCFVANGTIRQSIKSSWGSKLYGNMIFSADATYDIGAAGASRPRDYYGSGSIVVDGGGTFGSVVTSTVTAVGTAQTAGLITQNNTAAAAGAQQYSPMLQLTGQGWKTDATAGSQAVDFAFQCQPVQGASAPTGTLVLYYRVNAGSWTPLQTTYSSGAVSFGGAVTSTYNGMGTQQLSGGTFQNLTAAAAGAQQYSPMVQLTGQGWKTDATAGSQAVDFAMQVQPVQGTSAPTAALQFYSRINSGTWTNVFKITETGAIRTYSDAFIGTTGGAIVYSGGLYSVVTNAGVVLKGNKDAADTGTDVIVNSAATRTNGNLFEIQNNGAQKFAVTPGGYAFCTGYNVAAGGAFYTSGVNANILVKGNRADADTGYDVILQGTSTARTAGGIVQVQRPAVSTNQYEGLTLTNSTAAAAGAQQYSPMLQLTGQGWKTDATAGSQSVDFALQVQTAQGTAVPSGLLQIYSRINSGTWVNAGYISNVGVWYNTSQVTTYSGIGAAQTTALLVRNLTVAALDAQQYSPMIQLTGQGWATTGGASQTVDFAFQCQPVQGTAAPSGNLYLYSRVNGGAWTTHSIFSLGGTIQTTVGYFTTGAVGTAQNTGVFVRNITAAADGVQQYSPMIQLTGQGWKTDATAGSQAVDFAFQVQSVQGAAAPSGNLTVYSRINGATWGLKSVWTSGGTFYHYGVVESQIASIGTAQTTGLRVNNPTAAADGAQQYSPMLQITGQGWKTDATAASQAVDFAFQCQPVQGAAAPTGDLLFYSRVNAAASWTEVFKIGSGGYFEMLEVTAPAAPAANRVRVYAQDNGAGKTQLMALFGSGAAQQLAIEP